VPELSTLTFENPYTSCGKITVSNITEEVNAAPLRIAKEGAGDWTLGGTLAFTGGIDVREGTLNVGTMTSSLPYLRVDSGAALNLTGDAATANSLAIDMNEGVGTISGVSFAAHGTISVTNVVGEMEETTIACDSLGGCSGLGNISGWTVLVDGKRKGVSARATASGITFAKLGLVMIIK
jgi:autotransporter-associated beta strand protein